MRSPEVMREGFSESRPERMSKTRLDPDLKRIIRPGFEAINSVADDVGPRSQVELGNERNTLVVFSVPLWLVSLDRTRSVVRLFPAGRVTGRSRVRP